jgi:hypothetical protein
MIPLPEILAELIMALGGALLVANAWALIRPRVRADGSEAPQPQARGKVMLMAFIGLVVLVWGFASFINPR